MNATPSGIAVRRAGAEDAGILIGMILALAEYEKLPPPDAEAQARLVEDGFGPRPRFDTFLAELDGKPVAYAITFETYSTFLARPTLYLEDLFVLPEARRAGVGSAMLRFLARESICRGCGRMDWTVLHWNEMAKSVYRRIGAQELAEWHLCRLDREALQRLAES